SEGGGGNSTIEPATRPPIHKGYTSSAAPSFTVETASGSDDRAIRRGMKYGIAYSATPEAASGASAALSQRGSSRRSRDARPVRPCASSSPRRSSSVYYASTR